MYAHTHTLTYTLTRSCAQIKTHEQSNRMEIYEKTVMVLGPEVAKAKELLRFIQGASQRFADEVKTLAHPERRKDFISETYLLTMAKLINMFATLDALKNMKACINNDLACHKRYMQGINTGSNSLRGAKSASALALFSTYPREILGKESTSWVGNPCAPHPLNEFLHG